MGRTNLKMILSLVLLAACGGAIEQPTDFATAGCRMASPEAGADESLCPAAPPRIAFVTVCERPTVNPTPLETDCVETAYDGGRVWCCVPAAIATQPR